LFVLVRRHPSVETTKRHYLKAIPAEQERASSGSAGSCSEPESGRDAPFHRSQVAMQRVVRREI
jgi:hypothetical protein